MEAVKIEYLGHACFRLGWGGQRIVLDPYADGMIPGCPPLRTEADFVYCSHQHDDHNAVQNVRINDGGAPRFTVTELETDHDDAGGSQRGKNTVRIFDFDGIRVAHFGDLGRMLTETELGMLQGLDCALLPVGGFFTIDAAVAARIVRELQPRMVIPMHYRTETSGFDVLADIDEAMHAFDETMPVVTLTYGGYAMIEP